MSSLCLSVIHFRQISNIRNFAVSREKRQQNNYAFIIVFGVLRFLFSPVCKIEVPERLTVCAEALMRTGLADRCVSIPVREATDADITLVHRSVYSFTDSSDYRRLKSFLKATEIQHALCYSQQRRVFRSSEENPLYDSRGP